MDIMPPISPPVDSATHVQRPSAFSPSGSSFKAVLGELASRMDRGEASVHAVTQAAHELGSGGALLALQTGVYRYTETFEVAAKLVDKASSAVKTTLQGQ